MPETFLRDTDLAMRYGISRNTWWRWQRERTDVPRPVRLSPGCTRWKQSEIEAWESDAKSNKWPSNFPSGEV